MERLQVLIADDHPLFRKGMRTVLDAQPDLQVIGEAATGQEAVTMAVSLQPDLVLMDLQMPGVDGFQATRTIRQREHAVGRTS